jgi:hypothetical protein
MAKKKRKPENFYRLTIRVTPEMKKIILDLADMAGVQSSHLNSAAYALGFKAIQRSIDPMSQVPAEALEALGKGMDLSAVEVKAVVAELDLK